MTLIMCDRECIEIEGRAHSRLQACCVALRILVRGSAAKICAPRSYRRKQEGAAPGSPNGSFRMFLAHGLEQSKQTGIRKVRNCFVTHPLESFALRDGHRSRLQSFR